VDVEVRVVSVSCVARECLCAEAFSSDVTIKKKIEKAQS